MSCKSKNFQMFGVNYKTTQYSALVGIDMLKRNNKAPYETLHKTCAIFDGVEYPLSDPLNVDKYVEDVIAGMAPRIVLDALLDIVNDFNFGFLINWKPVHVPQRFCANIDSIASAAVDPLVSSIVQAGSATLRELEEFYSLEDAFAMMDIMTAKGVNDALAHESAQEEAKHK